MTKYCPVTCGVCKKTCVDLKSDCPQWTADGECYKNPSYLYRHCPKSCGVCSEDGHEKVHYCADFNTTQCHIWHDTHQCEENPLATFKHCPETCGACTHTCTDHDEGCKGWAYAKKCEDEPAFMLRVCPASCGVCTALEGNVKEEL